MRAVSLLNIIPIAVGLGACATDDEQVPVDNVAAQQIVLGDSGVAPDQVRIRSLSWAGTGCPAGTVAENLASDYQAFTLLFDAYEAELGPGLPLSRSRRNCQILVDLEFPQGWSYSVFDVDYRGFVNVGRGVSGVQQSAYYFQGEIQTARLQTTLRGPRVGDYQIRDSLPLDAVVWSPCGANRALIINSAIRLVNSSGNYNAQGLMTTDSIDGKVIHIYGLQWRRCPR
jgi:uncharacterized protein DUF4360